MTKTLLELMESTTTPVFPAQLFFTRDGAGWATESLVVLGDPNLNATLGDRLDDRRRRRLESDGVNGNEILGSYGLFLRPDGIYIRTQPTPLSSQDAISRILGLLFQEPKFEEEKGEYERVVNNPSGFKPKGLSVLGRVLTKPKYVYSEAPDYIKAVFEGDIRYDCVWLGGEIPYIRAHGNNQKALMKSKYSPLFS